MSKSHLSVFVPPADSPLHESTFNDTIQQGVARPLSYSQFRSIAIAICKHMRTLNGPKLVDCCGEDETARCSPSNPPNN